VRVSGSMTAADEQQVLDLEVRFEKGLQIQPARWSKSVTQTTVIRHIKSLVDTVRKCIANPEVSIEECLGPTSHDLDEIWAWNNDLPQTYDACMHDIVDERAQSCPEKVAISSWDGDLTYGQISSYSTALACSLKDAGIQLHDFLPVCFEKSRWTVVALLAVMKAGATVVLMDPTLPLARLQNMATQVGAKAIVASSSQRGLSKCIIPEGKQFVVEADMFARHSDQNLPQLSAVPPSAVSHLYVHLYKFVHLIPNLTRGS
jgi:fusarinine C synthase